MSKELVIGSNRHETKVAILEDDQLVEIYFQRANEYSLAGSIHKGRVTRVLPGMQSAFVDLGLERDTFLYVSDFFEEHDDIDTVSEEKGNRGDRKEKGVSRLIETFSEERVAETRSELPATDPAEPAEAAEGEEGVAAAAVGTATEPLDGKAPARAEPDRAFRTGDRRGRRSRRRRQQRGRGFPENKYAQTGTAAGPESEREPRPDEPENSRDVIILPGESLAKYRNIAVSSRAPEDSPERFEEEPQFEEQPVSEQSHEEDGAPEEDLEAEAEEIELADKILSHRDTEPSETEELMEEVKEDRPPEPPRSSASGAESSVEQAQVVEPKREPLPIAEPETETASRSFQSEATVVEITKSGFTASSEENEAELPEVPEGAPIEIDELDALETEETLPPVDEEFDDRAQPISERTPSVELLETPPAQTATLREPGGRYLHRVSRRMRRRRGGSHFQSPDFGAAESTGGGTGAAAAFQPEARPELVRQEAEERSTEKPERVLPSISDLLKPGQEIIVQIAKEPLGQKGARITSHIALPGRYVVFMPGVNHLGVSRKVSSEEERQRLKRILQAHRVGTTGGFIVRTAGEGVSEDEIATDMKFLYSLWLDIRQKAERKPAPALLHYDLDIVQRILRDQVTDDFKAIWVDNEEMYESVLTFMQRFQPALVSRVKMYTRSAPIFDAFNITQELERALRPKVWLKSGGYIVINQTEALVAIDINTGKYVGKSNRLEDTIVKTNAEAAKEIVRQIRLRDLGGIIVVDFIDMDERKNRQKVMQALEEAMRADRAPYKILQFNDFGLVAITRKRVKQSLERTLCSPCPYCEAAGYVKSVQTIIGEILVEAQKMAKVIEGNDVVLRVHPDVAKVLKASDNQYLEEIEEIVGRPVLVTKDPALHHEKFDLT